MSATCKNPLPWDNKSLSFPSISTNSFIYSLLSLSFSTNLMVLLNIVDK